RFQIRDIPKNYRRAWPARGDTKGSDLQRIRRMPPGEMHDVVDRLRGAALREEGAPTDGQLLEAFVARGDGPAFEALVRRHAPMVLGVCRRVAGHAHDADDAFQATFLVLVRKASAVVPRDLVGNWLY